jgi:hypothetical protein
MELQQKTQKSILILQPSTVCGVLIEGWNIGWEDWFGNWKENVLIFTSSYDFDLLN